MQPSDHRATEQRDVYAETLTAPLSWWAMAAAVVVTVFWCFVVATPVVAAVVAAAVAAAIVASILSAYAAKVAADDRGFRAGPALLPWQYVGGVQILDADQTRRLVGVDADARAYLVIRSYCKGAVRVGVADDRDPTPYWVVSTRHPDELALHLRARSMRD